MTPMVGTWCLRGCALVMVAGLLAGCARVVPGSAHAGGGAAPVPLADLLVGPERFPAQYPAVVLDSAAIPHVLQDIDGVAPGSVVTPDHCSSVPLAPDRTVAAQGIDSGTASSLIVAVTRPAPPLSARTDQLRGCPSFIAARGADIVTVTVTLLPAPPVDADDGCAIDQTVTSAQSVRRTLTFVAQIGDTRVSATWLQDGTPGEPDAASLDALFSDAVLKVRRGGD